MRPFAVFSNAVRAQQIVRTLARWGFEGVLSEIGTPRVLLRRFVNKKHLELSTHERIRLACEELGPTFVKFGQLVSSRPDIVPKPLVEELKKLRDHVDPVPYEKILPILEDELEQPIDQIFDELPREPFASGSLGQVYKARLKDGRRVAVKVQRPGIHKVVSADLEIIRWLAKQIHERIEGLRPLNLPRLVEDARGDLLAELDFTSEARNANLFNAMNPYQDSVFAPKHLDEFTSRRLLVMEWVEGVPPDQADLGEERSRHLARMGGASIFHQVVVSGFFHSDPHGGNILITPDERICLIDWGQAGQLTRNMRYLLADFFTAIMGKNPERIVDTAIRMGKDTHLRFDRNRIEKEVSAILRKYADVDQPRGEIGLIGLELLFALSGHKIQISSEYALLAKAIIAVEQTGTTLDPEFDLWAVARPFVTKLKMERWSVSNLVSHHYRETATALNTLREIPSDLQRVLRRIEDEDISINLALRDTHHLERTLSINLNRLMIGIVLGSLIIGSSIIITTGVGPFLWGYPAIGMVGFLISGILGLCLVVGIIRNKEHR